MMTAAADGGSDWRWYIPPLSAAVPITIFSVAALAIPLAAAERLGFSARTTSSWLFALYALGGLLSLVLTAIFKMPLLVAWHTALIAFFASQAGVLTVAELRGAVLVSGLAVAVLGISGLTGRITRLVPAPIIFAVVAGSILPFVVGTFDALGDERLLVAAVLVVWLASRRVLGVWIPPVLPALVAGVVVAVAAGRVEPLPGGWQTAAFAPAWPTLSFRAIITVLPIFVALTSLHSNLTATVYLRSQGYKPPARAIEVATGLGSAAGSFLGPTPICMAALVTPLTAGPDAGERPVRPWSVYAASGAFLAIGLAGGMAAGIPQAIPLALLLAVAGLALVGVLTNALTQITRGPLQLAPILTFAVVLSHLRLFGLGAAFWALVIGTGTALLLERDALKVLSEGENVSE
jgi:benzoate membrane transport protein